MLLVCFAHFLLAIGYATGGQFQPGLMLTLTVVASPAFMIISGVTFGFLIARSRRDPWPMRWWLINRAVLLLLPVHVFLLLAHITSGDRLAKAIPVIEITDTIALAMLINVWLVQIESGAKRLAVASVMFLSAWGLNIVWKPDVVLLIGLKDMLARAAWDGESVLHGFPVLPWAALHLAASVIGQRLGDMTRPISWTPVAHLTARMGSFAMLSGLAMKVGEVAMRKALILHASSRLGALISVLASPFGKYPPSPAYFLCCGGAGLMLLASAFAAEEVAWVAPMTECVAVLGRASLCVWVVQAWVYWVAVELLPVPSFQLLPLYFVATVVFIWSVAYVWDRNGWNRYLSLPMSRIAARHRHSDPALLLAAHRLR